MEQGLLTMGDNISDNYLSLYELVSDKDKTVEFAVTSDKSAKDKNGNLMSPKDIPLSFNDPVCDVYSDNKPEPRGSVGYTLAPLSHKWTKMMNCNEINCKILYFLLMAIIESKLTEGY